MDRDRRATNPSASPVPSASAARTTGAAVAPLRSPHSNRSTSPLTTPTTSAAAAASAAMAAPVFLPTSFSPSSQSRRSNPSTQPSSLPHPRSIAFPPMPFDAMNPIGTPFANSPTSRPTCIRIRRLPPNTTEETVRIMLLFSDDHILHIELEPEHTMHDKGFRSALVLFSNYEAAIEAKKKLHGRMNFAGTAHMVVEVLSTVPFPPKHLNYGRTIPSPRVTVSPTATSTSASSNPSSGPHPMVGSAHHGFANNLNSDLFSSHVDPDIFSRNGPFVPASPIGNHLHDRTHVSGKSLIENNLTDDDETTDLLRNPLAYAENGGASRSSANGRRATEPHILFGQFEHLNLNTTNVPPSSTSMPSPFGMSAHATGHTNGHANGHANGHMNGQSKGQANGHANGYMNGHGNGYANGHANGYTNGHANGYTNGHTNGYANGHANGHMNGTTPFKDLGPIYPKPPNRYYPPSHLPPINPADQNPPCNTLYVGNLPLETSEEELKALFSKQRGYKRLCFRAKHNGPMCFVEFESVSFATKVLNELYGHPLHNSTKGGIRLSFSKNPLGVRSQHNSGPSHSSAMGGMNGNMNGAAASRFTTASGPPPGLAVPPGLAPTQNHPSSTSNGIGSFPGNHPSSTDNGVLSLSILPLPRNDWIFPPEQDLGGV